MEQSAKFERFIYVMADLIEKYADTWRVCKCSEWSCR